MLLYDSMYAIVVEKQEPEAESDAKEPEKPASLSLTDEFVKEELAPGK